MLTGVCRAPEILLTKAPNCVHSHSWFFFFIEEFPDGVLESDDDEDEDDEVSWRLLTPIGNLRQTVLSPFLALER